MLVASSPAKPAISARAGGIRCLDTVITASRPCAARPANASCGNLEDEADLEHPEFRAHLVSCVQLRRVAAAVVRLPGLPPSRWYVA